MLNKRISGEALQWLLLELWELREQQQNPDVLAYWFEPFEDFEDRLEGKLEAGFGIEYLGFAFFGLFEKKIEEMFFEFININREI